ncbi:hypothetical protein D3C81_1648210 [compost metagenome]
MFSTGRMKFYDAFSHFIQEIPVMGYEQQRTIVIKQSGFQHFLAEQIQMVGRFVKD